MIETFDLGRQFGDFVAVDRLSFRVPAGSVLALLGPNGAGKTTTVRMLAGLLAPTEGTATVAGFDARRDPAAIRARVGLVTDVPGLYERMTTGAYLDFFGAMYGMPAPARVRRVEELIGFFELADHRTERMAGFSKGMKQKVALARALLHSPDVLFLDEPTSGLDPIAARAVRELIVSLKHAHRAIILCTHDLDEAERLADQVAIIRGGRLIACDTPAGLRAAGSRAVMVRVELAEPHPAALALLETVAGVLDPWVVPYDVAQPKVLLEYRTADPRAVNPRVVARLSADGAAIVSIICQTRTLEDVYVDQLSTREHPSMSLTAAVAR
ncbi:MAG TPA: ABC transporter ATP-binding protein [Chloroflexota bacterium]